MHAVIRAINILTTLIFILYSIAEQNTSRQALAGLVQCRYNAPHRNLVRLLHSNKLSCKLVSINSEELRTIQNQLQNYISALLKEISSLREELMNLKCNPVVDGKLGTNNIPALFCRDIYTQDYNAPSGY